MRLQARKQSSFEIEELVQKSCLTICQNGEAESWSTANNKESQTNSLTSCQVAKAERHGQLQTTENPKEIHLHTVKLPRQRDMVSCKQQRIPKKFTYIL
jgi:hypothetical protein